jgi:hypothetical protein
MDEDKEIVECSLPTCHCRMRADDAVWDETFDLPYCSYEHQLLGEDVSLSRKYEIENYVYGRLL